MGSIACKCIESCFWVYYKRFFCLYPSSALMKRFGKRTSGRADEQMSGRADERTSERVDERTSGRADDRTSKSTIACFVSDSINNLVALPLSAMSLLKLVLVPCDLLIKLLLKSHCIIVIRRIHHIDMTCLVSTPSPLLGNAKSSVCFIATDHHSNEDHNFLRSPHRDRNFSLRLFFLIFFFF